MNQLPLEVYRIDMKYIRNLHNIYARDLTNTANVLYAKYVSVEKFSAKEQCLDFKRMEIECKKFAEKRKWHFPYLLLVREKIREKRRIYRC